MLETKSAVAEKPEVGVVAASDASLVGAMDRARAFFASEGFRKAAIPLALAIGGLGFAFWPLLQGLPEVWLSEDGYYSHGFLIPLISAYIVFRNWERLKKIEVKPGWVALILFALLLHVTRAAKIADVSALWSASLLAMVWTFAWFVLGFRWALALTAPILYLAFALPIWTGIIDNYTNPLQVASTFVAEELLKVFAQDPLRVSPTVIHLNRFVLDVAVPCSGLKLLVAVTAFSVFFVLIARLRWWANLAMMLMVVPLCLFINGLRISLIGVVGNAYGSDAGMAFHDYSGYVTLIICFFILFSFARLLGWKQ